QLPTTSRICVPSISANSACSWELPDGLTRAIPNYKPNLRPVDIRELVKREEVESRLIWQEDGSWKMDTGPFSKLPSARQPGWTVLAQSVDLHDDGMAELMRQFRFISDARLDDVMISVATKEGGVGPHFDSYDVFLQIGRAHV